MKYLKKALRFLLDRYIILKWRNKKILANIKPEFKYEIQSLSENGFAKLNYDYSDFSEYILNEYTQKILSNKKIDYDLYPNNIEENIPNGLTLQCDLSLNDKKITDFILDDFLSNILKNYFGRDYYLRNNPTLQQIVAKQKNWESSEYHTDRLNQISLMLLLTDITKHDSHMEYLSGTQKINFLQPLHINSNHSFFYRKIKNCKKRFKLIGKKGQAFLFNSIGIHRSVWEINTTRNIFFLNFTAGHNLYNYLDKNLNIKNFENYNNKDVILRNLGERNFVSPSSNKFAYLKQYKNLYLG